MSDAAESVVLIAEDQHHLADLFGSALAGTYQVRVAYDGETAIDLYDAAVDVVLLDWKTPDVPGDEVLRHIRDESGDCGVAMISAVDPTLEVIDLEFDEYIVKPINMGELGSLVRTLRRRAECDETLRRYYRLTSKIVLLEEHLDPAKLVASEEYQRLQAELAEIDYTASGAIVNLNSEDAGDLLRSDSSS